MAMENRKVLVGQEGLDDHLYLVGLSVGDISALYFVDLCIHIIFPAGSNDRIVLTHMVHGHLPCTTIITCQLSTRQEPSMQCLPPCPV